MGGEDSAGKGKEKCRASCPASVCIFWGLDLAASVHAARRGRPVSKRRNTSVRAMTQALNLRACRSVSNQIAPSKKQPLAADVSLVLHSHCRGRQPGDPKPHAAERFDEWYWLPDRTVGEALSLPLARSAPASPGRQCRQLKDSISKRQKIRHKFSHNVN